MKVFSETKFLVAVDSYLYFRRLHSEAFDYLIEDVMDESDWDRVEKENPEVFAAYLMLGKRKRNEKKKLIEMLDRVGS